MLADAHVIVTHTQWEYQKKNSLNAHEGPLKGPTTASMPPVPSNPTSTMQTPQSISPGASAQSVSQIDDNAYLSAQPPEKPSSSFARRHRKAIVLSSIAAAGLIAAAILLGVLMPRVRASSRDRSSSTNSTGSDDGIPSTPPTLPTNVSYIVSLFNNTPYDDTTQANPFVPRLNESFPYGNQVIRGVNIGGWLVLEPFITPSLFEPYNPNPYNASEGVIDEWTLSAQLGPTDALNTLSAHYSSWATESDFQRIAAVGLDHVRIPIGYWAVSVGDGEPYVPNLSLFHFLRALEWARKYGLRVNVDIHALPGSQNGWNHSGRSGIIGWLNGTAAGYYNAYNRSLPIIETIAGIVTMPRYKNVVTLFGLVNEPRMTELIVDDVIAWEEAAYQAVRAQGFEGQIVIADGFLGLNAWPGKMQPAQGYNDTIIDAHLYQIFDRGQLATTHYAKISSNCIDARTLLLSSENRTTGFGPTVVGEWSGAETDCATWVNGVGLGNRFDGTFVDLQGPSCQNCSCHGLNDTTLWTPVYRQFLQAYAQSQMDGYGASWGWFFWNFKTESEPHWNYFTLVDQSILPQKAYTPSWTCANLSSIPQNILQR